MKTITLYVALSSLFCGFMSANVADNTEEAIEIVTELTELEIFRAAFKQFLTCIQVITPDNEQLFRTCIMAGALLKHKRFTSRTSLPEQLDWTMKLFHCMMEKIKNLAEHPTAVMCLEAIQKNIISHAYALLDKMRQEDDATQGAQEQDSTPLILEEINEL
jgi:hypothetical protein